MKRCLPLVLIALLATLIGGCAGDQDPPTPSPTAPPLYQGQLAFNSNRDWHYEVWLVNSDGTGLRQLTDGGLGLYSYRTKSLAMRSASAASQPLPIR